MMIYDAAGCRQHELRLAAMPPSASRRYRRRRRRRENTLPDHFLRNTEE